MLKRRNRVYRRIAVALTVALLAGQSHAFVLAEEGDTPQTEITGEAGTPDNGNVADGGNADNGSGENAGGTEQGGGNGGTDNQNPEDNENQGNQQGDGDEQDSCVCGTKCAADAVNTDCPVCAADYIACTGQADDAGNNGSENNGSENGDTENNDPENGGQDQCVCETACTEEAVNEDCPVCAADYVNCAKRAGEGVNPSADAALPEMAPGNMVDEEAGIAALANEGVEAYADEREITYDGVKYVVDGSYARVTEQDKEQIAGDVVIPESFVHEGITYTVTMIEEFAFYDCDKITSVTILARLNLGAREAFAYCNGLKKVKISAWGNYISDSLFYECSSLESVEIPDGVNIIDKKAFWGCTSLKSIGIRGSGASIELPDSVWFIEENAFAGCTGLVSVELPDSVANIKTFAFQMCTQLKSVKLEGETNIGQDAFSYCDKLTDVTISEKIKGMGVRAFYKCGELTRLWIVIPSDSEETFQFPRVWQDAFGEIMPSNRREGIIFIDENGAELTEKALQEAGVEEAFKNAAKSDGDSDDSTWYGWSLKKSSEVKDPNKVTITVRKDDTPWTDHNRTFALTKDGGTNFVTDLDAVEAGNYEIYDVTDSGNKLKTGVTVTVADADVPSTDPVNYYTVAFCYIDDDGNEQTYGDSTDWKPQTILKTVGRVAEPATNPTKADHTFDKWVTAQNGDDAFAFGTTPITAAGTKIYAKWTDNTVTTYYTVTFYDGTTPYGADTPQRPQSVASGQQADRPEDPDKAGWEFAGWKTADGGSTSYDFDTPVIGDTSIYASWVEKTVIDSLRIQATATEGGTIVPKGEIIVSKGGERTFTITPDEGNKIKAVTVDGEDVTAELKDTLARAQTGARYYTFTNIVQNHTIHAEFERDGSSSGGGGGGDNPDPGGDNPGGGGDNPNPGGGGGGGGDNPDPGDDDDGKKPGGGGNSDGGDHSNPGGGNNGGGTNPDGGNGTGNMVNADNGNGAGNGQTVAGTAVSSAQAGGGAATVSAGNHAASDGSKAAGESGGAANGREPKTGDASYLEVYATLAMIAGLTYLLLYVMEESRGMSEREKEAFVAAFIRWGKKGGAFRKCCAMAAIFCLLAYYHIIGKNVGGNALREKHLGQAF